MAALDIFTLCDKLIGPFWDMAALDIFTLCKLIGPFLGYGCFGYFHSV